MLRKAHFFLATGCLFLLSSCDTDDNINLLVSNELDEVREDAALIISDQAVLKHFKQSPSSVIAIKPNGTSRSIYGQLDDLDQDGLVDEAFFLLAMSKKERTAFTVSRVNDVSVEPRTQFVVAVKQNGYFDAKGRYISDGGFVPVDVFEVPEQQQQDSQLAYMEGPLWESELVGFRYYLDDRNRYDVFGKSQPVLALHTISGDYHALSSWGADVLKVGQSMGLGSIAMMTNGGPAFIDNVEKKTLSVLANGPLRSIMRTAYTGWNVDGKNVDVISDLEIRGGASWTEQRLHIKGAGNHFMSTGIVKHSAATEFITGTEKGVFFGYTWGKQSEQGDLLGMAIIIPGKYNPKVITNDQYSHLIAYKPINDRAEYRFMAGWEHGTVAVKTRTDFEEAIREVARRYAYPVSYQ